MVGLTCVRVVLRVCVCGPAQAVNFNLFLDNKTFEYPIHITLIKQKFTPNMRNWTPLIAEVIEPAYVDGLLRNLGGPYYRGARQVLHTATLTSPSVAC